jgi:hypothetical protein
LEIAVLDLYIRTDARRYIRRELRRSGLPHCERVLVSSIDYNAFESIDPNSTEQPVLST